MIIYNTLYPDIMTADELCEVLNISKNHCLALLNSGKIKGFKINKSRAWRISRPALQQYLSYANRM